MADVQFVNVAFSVGVMHFTVKSATDALPAGLDGVVAAVKAVSCKKP